MMMVGGMRIRVIFLVLALGCISQTLNAGPFEKIDAAKEIQLGRQVAREIERRIPLSSDKTMQERVKRIGQLLVQYCERKEYPYEFKVLSDPEFNAFALPGGFIYLNEGLVAQMKSDDELAFIIGHEISHVAKRHWAKQADKEQWAELALGVLGILAGSEAQAIGSLVAGLLSLSYSRDQEREADGDGLTYMWKAGFNPEGAINAAKMLVELERGVKTPKFLRDHPGAKERLNYLENRVKKLPSEPTPSPTPTPPPAPLDFSTLVGDLRGLDIADNPYFPLAVGNEWVYEVQTKGARSTYTLRIVAAIPTPQGTVYRAEIDLGKGNVVTFQVLTTKKGVYRRMRPHLSSSQWQIDSILNESVTTHEESGWRYEIMGMEAISAPCGNFSQALKVSKTEAASSKTYQSWFVKGVGMIKRVSVDGETTEVLVRYKVVNLVKESVSEEK